VSNRTVFAAPVPPPDDAMEGGGSYQRDRPAPRIHRSEEFAAPASAASPAEWRRQCAALYVSLGVASLYLLDPVTMLPSARISLRDVHKISPTVKYLHCLDLEDRAGCIWQIAPEGLDADDVRGAAQRWLIALSAVTSPTTTEVVHVVKCGYLSKRGQLNTALKRRWFVLCTDYSLRYYKDDLLGGHKGVIDLATVGKVQDSTAAAISSLSGEVVRFDRDLVVRVHANTRQYAIQAEDAAAAEAWILAFNDFLLSPLRAMLQVQSSISGSGGGGGNHRSGRGRTRGGSGSAGDGEGGGGGGGNSAGEEGALDEEDEDELDDE
jgi:uncharacterized membrane protein YgcG